jgi:hypothetical protein
VPPDPRSSRPPTRTVRPRRRSRRFAAILRPA